MTIKWATAFSKAVNFMVFTVICCLGGGILFLIGLGGLGIKPINSLPTFSLFLSMIFLIVGFLILFLGPATSFFKAFGDIVFDEIEERKRKENK
jgi:hypothetical protein